MARIKNCIFCGTAYEYCGHCSDSNKYPSWKFNFDSEKCHDLYEVVAGYNMGVNTIEDIKNTLDKYNVTDYSIFSKKLQDKLNELIPQKKDEPETKDEVDEEKKEEKYIPRKIKKNGFERRVSVKE